MKRIKLPDLPTLTRTVKHTLQHLAQKADTPLEIDIEIAIYNLLKHHRQERLRWAFYVIVDMTVGEFAQQQGLDQALGAPTTGFTMQEFFARIHPDYLPRYFDWGFAVHEAYFRYPTAALETPVYHITVPLRHADGTYHWYTQRSVGLQADVHGYLVSYFNLYDYGGPWNIYNRRPLLPFITHHQETARVLENQMLELMRQQLQDRFTPVEQWLLHEFIHPPSEKARWKGTTHTRHKYHANLLKKARALFCCDFATARDFALFLEATGLQGIYPSPPGRVKKANTDTLPLPQQNPPDFY